MTLSLIPSNSPQALYPCNLHLTVPACPVNNYLNNMVIKSKIYDFLKKNLGEYLYGFQKNQLDVGLLSGHIDLVNVNFRPSKVNQLLGTLGLPVTLKAGLLGKLRLKCHYTSFLSSPIEVKIDELLLIFGPITQTAREDKGLAEDNVFFEEDEKLTQQPSRPIIPKRHVQQGQQGQFDEDIETPRQNPEMTPRETRSRRGQPKPKPASHHSAGESARDGGRPSRRTNNECHENSSKSTSFKEDSGKCNKDIKGNKDCKDYKDYQDYKDKMNNETEANAKAYQNMKKPPHHPRHYPDERVYVEEPRKEGLIEKYFSKVLKNLVLTVKSVHIRYEDETYAYLNPYSIGVSLSRLEVKNVSQEWLYKDGKATKRSPPKNATVKEINLTSFAMYISSMSSVLIPTSLWEATLPSEIGIFEALPAYEVRDLFIMESSALSKDHPCTFISPTNVQLSVSFYEKAPTLRVSTFINKAVVQFSSSMAECMRNFFDYVTNVQIWPLVLRFRPYRRIPEKPAKPAKRERRKERKKRREIVRLWFQYAYAFVKTKRAAIRYMKERKQDNELFKKMEKQEKIREKVLKGQREVACSRQSAQKPLSGPSSRRLPGQAELKLNDLIKNFSDKNSSQGQALKRRPYDGDTYFPKQVANSEIDFNLNYLHLTLKDEDTDVGLVVSAHGLAFLMHTLLDEMKTVLAVNEVAVSLADGKQVFETCKIAKGKQVGTDLYALHISKTYRPAEVIVPGDLYLTLNMYEIQVAAAPVTIAYNKDLLNLFFVVKKGLELDKCFRDNVDLQYIDEFHRHCKKYKVPKTVGSSLKRFAICKLAAQSLKDLQENIDVAVHDLHSDIANITFDVQVDFEGGSLALGDGKPANLTLNVGKTKVSVVKDRESTYMQAFGYKLKTENAPIAVHEFFMTLYAIFTKQMKQIQTCARYGNRGNY